MARTKKTDETLDSSGSQKTSGTSMDFFAGLKQDLIKSKQFHFSKYDSIPIKKSTGFDILDALLASNSDSRGFQLRTFNTFYGNSGSGKTTLLLQIASNIVRGTQGGIILIDAEKTAYDPVRYQKLGLVTDKLMTIASDTTVENFYRLMNKIAENRSAQLEEMGEDWIMENPIIVIVDSFTSMSVEKLDEGETDINSVMGLGAKLHSQLLPKVMGQLFSYNITVLGIIQPRDNLTIGPTPKAKTLAYVKNDTTLPGGRAIPFFSFYLAELKFKQKLDESWGKIAENNNATLVEFNLGKSKSSPANKPVSLIYLQNAGFSNLWTNYKILLDLKVIQIAGAYKKLEGFSRNFYTKELEELYNTNEEFRLAFDKAIKENLKTYIDEIPETNVSFTIPE